MNLDAHWKKIYETKDRDEWSWHRDRPEVSLELIEEVADGRSSRILDAGGGASRLVDHLIEDGNFEITVVDIAPNALALAKQRLGERAGSVDWIAADLTRPLDLDERYEIWHDRAAFHFLTAEGDRKSYLENLERHLAPGGYFIAGTFGPQGPESCSGLEVRQYSLEKLAETLGAGWDPVETRTVLHRTPWGDEQQFFYGVFQYRETANES